MKTISKTSNFLLKHYFEIFKVAEGIQPGALNRTKIMEGTMVASLCDLPSIQKMHI